MFAGCDKKDEYYKETGQVAIEFYEAEEYNFLFDDNISIDFGTPINNAISGSDTDYATLSNFYQTTLNNLTFMFSTFNANLNLEPKNNNNKVKNAYKNLENKISNLKTTTDNFLQEKELFVSAVGSSPNSTASKAHLRHFKTHYKELLYVAKDFYQAFESVYTLGFLSYPNLNTNILQPGTQKIMSVVVVGKLTALNLEYMFDDNSDIEQTSNSLKILQEAYKIKQASTNPTKDEATITLESLKTFLQIEETFNTEINQFKYALENLSLSDYHSATNKQSFLSQDNNQLYFNKLTNFVQTYTTIYADAFINNIL